MSGFVLIAVIPPMPSDVQPSVQSDTHMHYNRGTSMTGLATALQTFTAPLLASLPRRINVDKKNGDLYTSKSSDALKTNGWDHFQPNQRFVLAQRVVALRSILPPSTQYNSNSESGSSKMDNATNLSELFDELRAARFYSERAKELWSAIKTYELEMETGSMVNMTTAMMSEELDRSVLEDIINDVETASKKNSSLLTAAAHEDLVQIRLVLDMARDAALYAKEAKETYELLSTKVRSVDSDALKPAGESQS